MDYQTTSTESACIDANAPHDDTPDANPK